MQKICLLAFSLLIFFFSFNTSFAQASDSSEKVNYELPYPGLLPDSPIYFLRIIRDKAVGFLIADPLKKAEFNLLQADKRLNAGIYLFSKGKISISISTISKAQNYFEQAIQKIKEAKSQGMETTKITNRLINSSEKHQEVLRSLAEKSAQSFKENFNSQNKRAEAFEKELRELISKV